MCDTYYRGIGPNAGKVVPADEALEYSLEQCGLLVDARAPAAKEFLDMLPDCFFSGNWVKEGENTMENGNSAPVTASARKEAHHVSVRHVGRVEMKLGNLWLCDGLGGISNTLESAINEELAKSGREHLNMLAELVLTIEPLDGAGTDVEVV